MPPHCPNLGIQLRQPMLPQLSPCPPFMPSCPFPLVWCCSPQALSVLCGPSSCLAPALQHSHSWSLEKSHPFPGTAWTTEQEVRAGDNYKSRSVEIHSSDLVKNLFIHMRFGRMQRLEVLCVCLGSHFLTCLSFPRL